jgi:hypothetical protein
MHILCSEMQGGLSSGEGDVPLRLAALAAAVTDDASTSSVGGSGGGGSAGPAGEGGSSEDGGEWRHWSLEDFRVFHEHEVI